MSRPHLTPSDKKFASANGEVADNFRFPRRCAPRNDDCVRHCEAWYKPWQSLARRGTIRCHAERSRSISSLATCYEHRLLSASRRFFVTLRMTSKVSLLQAEALYDVMLSEVEASPRWLHAMNIVSCRPCTKKASTFYGQRSYKWCLLNHIEIRVVI